MPNGTSSGASAPSNHQDQSALSDGYSEAARCPSPPAAQSPPPFMQHQPSMSDGSLPAVRNAATASPHIPYRRRRPKNAWLRLLRYGYCRLIRLHSSPDYLARGLAIGVFSGFLPFFGLQVILSIAGAWLLRGHRVVAAAATWISNPLTYIPLYSLGFHLGRWMLDSEQIVFEAQTFNSTQAVLALGSEFAVTLLTGCIALGFFFASISYVVGLYLLKRAKQRRSIRRRR